MKSTKKNTACSEHFRRSAIIFVVGSMHSAPEHTCTVAFTGAPAFLSAFAGLSELSRQLTFAATFAARESSRVKNLYKFFFGGSSAAHGPNMKILQHLQKTVAGQRWISRGRWQVQLQRHLQTC